MFKNDISYDQTTNYNTKNPSTKIFKKEKEHRRLHERGRNNHCAPGSQKSNVYKKEDIESTVLNSNLELLKKSVEMFKNKKEEVRDFENLSKQTPISIKKSDFSKKISFPDEIKETPVKNKNTDRSKYKSNQKKPSLKNPSIHSLSSNGNRITFHKSSKHTDDTTNVNDSKILITKEPPKTSEYYMRSNNTSAPSKRKGSLKLTETLNVDECCLPKSSNPQNTLNKSTVPDHSGPYSSKQLTSPSIKKSDQRWSNPSLKPPTIYNSCCFHRPITPPHGRKPIQNSSCCWCFQQQSSQHTDSPILNCFCYGYPEKQYLPKTFSPPEITIKTSIPDDNGYYSSNKQSPHSITTSAIGSNNFSKKNNFPKARIDTLIKNISMDNNPKYNGSNSEPTSKNQSMHSNSSEGYRLTTFKLNKSSRPSQNFNKDVSNLKTLNSVEPKTRTFDGSSHNTLAANFKRQYSNKSTQTTNYDDCCNRRFSSTPKTANTISVPEITGHYSSKQQFPHPVISSAFRNETNEKASKRSRQTQKSRENLSDLPYQQPELNRSLNPFRHSNYSMMDVPSAKSNNAFLNQRSYLHLNTQNNITLGLP